MDVYKVNERMKYVHSQGYQRNFENRLPGNYSPINSLTQLKLQPRPNQFMSGQVIVAHEAARLKRDYDGCFAMESDLTKALRSINESKLAEIVRMAIKKENFRIQGWRVRKLDAGNAGNVNPAIYRFEGTGVDRGEWVDWSVILKVIQSPANLGYINCLEGEDCSHWNYWKRELLLYQSGWLDSLPEGLAAPRCYEATELPGEIAGLWLEDVVDSFAGPWPLYRYALTARHLGRLNGIYISRRQHPTYPWFGSQRTRQWLNSIAWWDFPWDHPRLRQHFHSSNTNSFRSLLEENAQFLARLDQLPSTVTHGDTFPVNFRSRRTNRSQEQTIAMDWAQVGIEPLGDDLGQLVYGTHMNLKGYKLQDISNTLFTSYMHGLEDASCRIDPQWVRFGYVVSAAFRVGLLKLNHLLEVINNNDEELIPHFVFHPAAMDAFESHMADEAYQLLDMI